MSLTTPDVEAMLEGNEEVVQLQLRAGNISSGRPAGQCAKEQKKRDASEQSTEEAPSSEEVEVAPRRFDGTVQPGWGFLMPKSSSLSPPAAASTAPGKGATVAPAPKKAKVSHETMSKTEQTVIVESFFSTYQMSKTGRRYDTVDADSHDNWAAYHVLKADGQKLVDGDLFNDIKRATAAGLNNHRNVVPVERKAAEEEEEKRREEEGEE